MPHSELSSVRARENISPRRADFIALGQFVSGSATLLLFALAVLFAARRLAGGLQVPLPPAAVFLVGVMLIIVAAALRVPWTSRSVWRTSRIAAWLGLTAPLVVVVLLSAAISLPETAPWSLALLWFGVLTHETAWGVWWWRHRRVPGPMARPVSTRAPAFPSPVEEADDEAAVEAPEPASHAVTQRIVRSRGPDGAESIAGSLRADFVTDERTQSLHVAFCPPLKDVPTFHCEQIGGPAARITVAEVQSYGARIDVRLSRVANEPTSVVVEFYAQGRST